MKDNKKRKMEIKRILNKKRGGKLFQNKKSQQTLGLSFSVIFSILLIVFFILIAFIAINAFLKTKDCAQIGIFINNFETEINKAWDSQKDSFEFRERIPSKLDYVCFANLSKRIKGEWDYVGEKISIYKGAQATLFFYPPGKACEIPYKNVRHLNIEGVTDSDNPYCIKIEDGVAKIRIEKGFNDALVSVR